MKPNELKDFFLLRGCNYLILRNGSPSVCNFEFGFTSCGSKTDYIDFLPGADIRPGDLLSNPREGEFRVVDVELHTYGTDETPYQIRAHCEIQFRVADAEHDSVCLNIQDDRPVYKVSSLEHPKQLFDVTDPIDSVKVCVCTILLTPKGTVPLYREFGIDWNALEYPLPVAKAMLVAEIKNALERWEPRVRLVGLKFEENIQEPSKPAPVVWVTINTNQ